jgi:hypothetical protein
MSENSTLKNSISTFLKNAKAPLVSSAAVAAIIFPVSIYVNSSANAAKIQTLDAIASECSAYQNAFSELYSKNPDAALQKLIDDGGRIEKTKKAEGYGLKDSYKIASTTINPDLSRVIDDLYADHSNRFNRGEMKLNSKNTDCVIVAGMN